MNLRIVILLTVSTLCSCTLFKRTTKTTDQTHAASMSLSKLTHLEEQSRQTDARKMKYQRDSTQLAYSIQLWPKGTLTFLPGGGFTGEFDHIILQGNQNQISQFVEKTKVGDLQKAVKKTEVDTRQEQKSDTLMKTKQSSPAFKVIIVSLIVVIAGLFFWIKR